jgi:hypothetical protein
MPESGGLKLANSQRKLFSILEEFFRMASGKGIGAVPSLASFGDWVRKNAQKFAASGAKAFPWVYDGLTKFYEESRHQGFFGQAKQLGGIKLVLGGTNRFTRTRMGVASTLLT